jgi:cell division transport system permease protein
MMALAAVLTVAVSLSLVGTSLLLRQGVDNQVGEWSNNVSLQVFVNADATPAQAADVLQLIKATPQITGHTYLDHEQSYLQMKTVLANDPTAIAAITPAETPPDYRCTLQNPNDAQTVASIFQGTPGVFRVEWPAQSIRVMQSVASVAQKILLAIALVLMVSSLVLILNAIRMAIFARRREVGVMKLVGATNWFIRVPFMLEGLVQGLLGAIVAGGVVLLTNILVNDFIRDHVSALGAASVSGSGLLVTEIVVVALGTLVGAISSFVAVHRFLDV